LPKQVGTFHGDEPLRELAALDPAKYTADDRADAADALLKAAEKRTALDDLVCRALAVWATDRQAVQVAKVVEARVHTDVHDLLPHLSKSKDRRVLKAVLDSLDHPK